MEGPLNSKCFDVSLGTVALTAYLSFLTCGNGANSQCLLKAPDLKTKWVIPCPVLRKTSMKQPWLRDSCCYGCISWGPTVSHSKSKSPSNPSSLRTCSPTHPMWLWILTGTRKRELVLKSKIHTPVPLPSPYNAQQLHKPTYYSGL